MHLGVLLVPCGEPFIFEGLVSLTGESSDQCLVSISRDTGGSQSVIPASALQFTEVSACGYGAVLHGIEMGCMPRPVHRIHVQSKFVIVFFPYCCLPCVAH